MKKIIIYISLFIVCFMLAVNIVEAKLESIQHTKPIYEYTLKNGSKGVSRHCFNKNDKLICRDIKNVIRVVKFEIKEWE